MSIQPRPYLDFPAGHHLLITTPSCIYAWDTKGIEPVFTSSKKGIVAARETKDGSGVLAVADQHVVVLHDTKRGQEKSWGLNAHDDQVRHLEYAQGTKTLFLSTSLTNVIQAYSTERSRLLSPSQVHVTPPIALAVSPTGHLMVSTSDKPPAVYLRSIAHNSIPVLIEPRASETAATFAAFHPERANIFLLAFRDGTLAAYDATKVLRKTQGSYSNQESIDDGEISRVDGAHRPTSKLTTQDGTGVKPTTITGAAFLPGYKTRAVSVGSDGRCKIVDFADGGVVVRTWHAKAPLCSVSVLPVKPQREAAPRISKKPTNIASHTIGGPTSTNSLIAVGRADGQVHIYDLLGLLLARKAVSDDCERLISVEWIKGTSPQPVKTRTKPETVTKFSEYDEEIKKESAPPASGLGLPPGLRPNDTASPRKFTIHPDEVEEEGTVRHTPSPKRTGPLPNLQTPTTEYLDLFSPVKPAGAPEPVIQKPIASSSRARPRISSQTFIQSNETGPLSRSMAREVDLSPDLSPKDQRKAPNTSSGRKVRTGTSLKSVKKSRRSMAPAEILPNDNAKVLADLRKMSTAVAGPPSSGPILAFAKNDSAVRSTRIVKAKSPAKRHHHMHFPSLRSPAKQKAWDPGNVLEREVNWPTDSMQDQSLNEDEEDIWMTSDDDKTTKNLRQRRLKPLTRILEQQAAQRGLDAPGTTGSRDPPAFGSTEDEMYTARSHISPSSEHVREVFPRSSSISPKRKKSPSKRAAEQADRNLRDIPPNTAPQGRSTSSSKDPWTRAKMEKQAQAAQPMTKAQRNDAVAEELQGIDIGTGKSVLAKSKAGCDDCKVTSARVDALEDELARVKGEVMMLRAVLRRNGVAAPPGLQRQT